MFLFRKSRKARPQTYITSMRDPQTRVSYKAFAIILKKPCRSFPFSTFHSLEKNIYFHYEFTTYLTVKGIFTAVTVFCVSSYHPFKNTNLILFNKNVLTCRRTLADISNRACLVASYQAHTQCRTDCVGSLFSSIEMFLFLSPAQNLYTLTAIQCSVNNSTPVKGLHSCIMRRR